MATIERAIWKGALLFGRVEIPMGLYPGDHPDSLDLALVDDRDLSPISYRKVNRRTGRAVPADHVARGYRLEDGRIVLVTEDDLKAAAPTRTRTIRVDAFVDPAEVPPFYFHRPYYLKPGTSGLKAYTLLRDSMSQERKAAVGTFVLHMREHLALVFVEAPWLMLSTLRYPSQISHPSDHELHVAASGTGGLEISEEERELSRQLILEQAEHWLPERYKDEYRELLLEAIERKANTGAITPIAEASELPAASHPLGDSLVSLLRQSVAQAPAAGPRRGQKTG